MWFANLTAINAQHQRLPTVAEEQLAKDEFQIGLEARFGRYWSRLFMLEDLGELLTKSKTVNTGNELETSVQAAGMEVNVEATRRRNRRLKRNLAKEKLQKRKQRFLKKLEKKYGWSKELQANKELHPKMEEDMSAAEKRKMAALWIGEHLSTKDLTKAEDIQEDKNSKKILSEKIQEKSSKPLEEDDDVLKDNVVRSGSLKTTQMNKSDGRRKLTSEEVDKLLDEFVVLDEHDRELTREEIEDFEGMQKRELGNRLQVNRNGISRQIDYR